MIRVMRLADDKSDKFWRIETLGPDFMINWGKTGTSGRYGLREFPDEQTCLAQASELVDIKTQKGYTDLHDFDPMSQYYYDDDSIGLHPLTSHPTFREYFTEPFYYSSIADAAPFGSDEGIDALWELSDLLRRRPHAELGDFPQQLLHRLYNLPFHPPHGETIEELEGLKEAEIAGKSALRQLQRTDQVIIAAALAQIKITGQLHPSLYRLALLAIERLGRIAIARAGTLVTMTSETLASIARDLKRYWAAQR
jgi:molybdate metabolism regulator